MTIDELLNKYSAVEKGLDSLQKNHADLVSFIEDSKKSFENHRAEIEKLDSDNEESLRKLGLEISNLFSKMNGRAIELEDKITSLSNEMNLIRNNIDAAKNDLPTTKKQIDDLKESIENIVDRMDLIEDMLDNISKTKPSIDEKKQGVINERKGNELKQVLEKGAGQKKVTNEFDFNEKKLAIQKTTATSNAPISEQKVYPKVAPIRKDSYEFQEEADDIFHDDKKINRNSFAWKEIENKEIHIFFKHKPGYYTRKNLTNNGWWWYPDGSYWKKELSEVNNRFADNLIEEENIKH